MHCYDPSRMKSHESVASLQTSRTLKNEYGFLLIHSYFHISSVSPKDGNMVTVVTIRFVTMFAIVCVRLDDVKDVLIAISTETQSIEMPKGQSNKGWR